MFRRTKIPEIPRNSIAELRAQIEESPPQGFYLRPAPPNYRSVRPPPPREMIYRQSPPVSPPPLPPVTPPVAARTCESAPRRGSGICWWLLGFPVIVGLLSQPPSTQSGSRWVEVRALPVIPGALPVDSQTSAVSNAPWQSVRMPDGTIVQPSLQGELPSSASLPPQGRFIGEEYSTGTTSWIWMTPAGASFPSWADP